MPVPNDGAFRCHFCAVAAATKSFDWDVPLGSILYMDIKKTFYKVFAPALETRKPRREAGRRQPKIDEDGIHTWYWTTSYNLADAEGFQIAARHATVCGNLNAKRALRAQVEPRLEALAQQITALKSQLDRIERRLGSRDAAM